MNVILNENVINHILSFLPIRNNASKLMSLHTELYRVYIFKKWSTIYSKMYHYKPLNYIDLLERDITIWCNNNIDLFKVFTPKYKKIINKISTNSSTNPYHMFGRYSSKKMVLSYFISLDESEIVDLNNYLMMCCLNQ